MTQETLEKLKKLKLLGMARAYQTSLENDKLLELSADELINMLVEAECDDRLNRNIERRLRNAKFRYQSNIENIDFEADRNLDRNQMMRFAECTFIKKTRKHIDYRKHGDRQKPSGHCLGTSSMHTWI